MIKKKKNAVHISIVLYCNELVLKKEHNAAFWETMENVRSHRDKAYNNQSKKKLFGVRSKLSYNKKVFR